MQKNKSTENQLLIIHVIFKDILLVRILLMCTITEQLWFV
jgi:hypothetical protein